MLWRPRAGFLRTVASVTRLRRCMHAFNTQSRGLKKNCKLNSFDEGYACFLRHKVWLYRKKCSSKAVARFFNTSQKCFCRNKVLLPLCRRTHPSRRGLVQVFFSFRKKIGKQSYNSVPKLNATIVPSLLRTVLSEQLFFFPKRFQYFSSKKNRKKNQNRKHFQKFGEI